jgi:hypothetical protein
VDEYHRDTDLKLSELDTKIVEVLHELKEENANLAARINDLIES